MTFKMAVIWAGVVALFIVLPAQAGLKSEAVEVAADYVMRKFGREVTKELGDRGAMLLTRKIETLAAKYGEKEAISAIEKVGPRAFRLVEEVGEEGASKAIKLMGRVGEHSIWIVGNTKRMAIFVKFGDDAADAMLKHGDIAAGLVEQFGPPSARALKAVNGQNARRLAMMAENGQLTTIPKNAELMETIGKAGDGAMNWVWNNKGALTATAVLAKFIQNPQPFIDGSVKVVDIGGEKLVKPVISEIAGGVVKSTNWTIVITASAVATACLWLMRHWLRQRPLCQPAHVLPPGEPEAKY